MLNLLFLHKNDKKVGNHILFSEMLLVWHSSVLEEDVEWMWVQWKSPLTPSVCPDAELSWMSPQARTADHLWTVNQRLRRKPEQLLRLQTPTAAPLIFSKPETCERASAPHMQIYIQFIHTWVHLLCISSQTWKPSRQQCFCFIAAQSFFAVLQRFTWLRSEEQHSDLL